jgi:nucleoside-diphosphate-sugar epimerase
VPLNDETTARSAIVIGAHGVIGRAAAYELVENGWQTTTVSRRGPLDPTIKTENKPRHVSANLLDPKASKAAFADLSSVTHVVYAAYAEMPSMREAVTPNTTMLKNTLDALVSAGADLESVVVIGGGKSYGEHLGPYKTPAKESDPRFLGPIFYNNQEDLLKEEASRRGFSWTVLRPDGVFGFSSGSPMNIVNGLAVFASLSKQAGVPLRFPGTPGTWNALHQATDATLLARAIIWALTSETARNEVFNVTNGDHFRWRQIWTDIAEFFDMPVAEPQPMSLVQQMADKESQWQRLTRDNRLRDTPWRTIAAWPFVDGWLASDWDMVQSTIKIRQAGFTDCIDSHSSLLAHLEFLRTHRYVP